MKIIGIDPGETTGVCVWRYPQEQHSVVPLRMDSFDLQTLELPLWKGLDKLLVDQQPDIVVYENFRLFSHKANQKKWSEFPTVQTIGVIKYLCDLHNIKLVKQSPKDKALYSDKRLKELNLYDKRSPHERDAIRHALFWATKSFDREDVI